MKNNFKSGFISGSCLGIGMLVCRYFVFQHISEQAENVANLDLHQLEYQDLEEKKCYSLISRKKTCL